MADYQAFIGSIVAKLNQQHPAKFAEEQHHLQPLPPQRIADYEVLTARVSRRSTIDVRCILYTVPSRLIGRQLELHLYHDRICGYLDRQLVVELPRIRVSAKDKRRARCINYRHVIAGLRRKPRALIYCTWQQDLWPNDAYRQVWQQLQADFDIDSAAVLRVEALYIAATQDKESAVAEYLAAQLTAGTLTVAALQRHFQLLHERTLPAVQVHQHDLKAYDQLLQPDSATESLPESQPPPQTPAPLPYAPPLGNPGTSGHARTGVLRSILAGTVRIGGGPTLECAPQTRPARGPTARRKNGFQF